MTEETEVVEIVIDIDDATNPAVQRDLEEAFEDAPFVDMEDVSILEHFVEDGKLVISAPLKEDFMGQGVETDLEAISEKVCEDAGFEVNDLLVREPEDCSCDACAEEEDEIDG